MSRYMHSAMRSEAITFALRIDKFSKVVRRGYYEGPEFQGERSGSKWSLTVYASEGVEYEDFIDIRLQRNDSDGKDQFVEFKVAIDDYLGMSHRSKEGQFCFTGTKNNAKVMSVPYISGFQRLRFLPDDTLTIRGEMTVYEETELSFENEDDFERSRENSNSARHALVRWILGKLLICLAGVAGLVAIKAIILYAIMNLLLPFLHYVVLPFIAFVLISTMSFFWLRREANKILRRKSNARHHSWKPNEYSGYGMELVPAAHGEYGQTVKYHSGGKNYNKPLKHGGYGKIVIYRDVEVMPGVIRDVMIAT